MSCASRPRRASAAHTLRPQATPCSASVKLLCTSWCAMSRAPCTPAGCCEGREPLGEHAIKTSWVAIPQLRVQRVVELFIAHEIWSQPGELARRGDRHVAVVGTVHEQGR